MKKQFHCLIQPIKREDMQFIFRILNNFSETTNKNRMRFLKYHPVEIIQLFPFYKIKFKLPQMQPITNITGTEIYDHYISDKLHLYFT